jgi:hypothetical protein
MRVRLPPSTRFCWLKRPSPQLYPVTDGKGRGFNINDHPEPDQ